MKKVFYSFHYTLDNWRVQQIRNIGVVDGQRIYEPNEWEEIKRKGEPNIKKWIDENMRSCDCVIVLIGEQTHTRKWVKYEVKRAKELKKPIFGIFIHKLKDSNGKVSKKGRIPKPRGARNIKQLVRVERTLHSQKPIEVLQNIEKMFPTQDKIELFARQTQAGWEFWGTES